MSTPQKNKKKVVNKNICVLSTLLIFFRKPSKCWENKFSNDSYYVQIDWINLHYITQNFHIRPKWGLITNDVSYAPRIS